MKKYSVFLLLFFFSNSSFSLEIPNFESRLPEPHSMNTPPKYGFGKSKEGFTLDGYIFYSTENTGISILSGHDTVFFGLRLGFNGDVGCWVPAESFVSITLRNGKDVEMFCISTDTACGDSTIRNFSIVSPTKFLSDSASFFQLDNIVKLLESDWRSLTIRTASKTVIFFPFSSKSYPIPHTFFSKGIGDLYKYYDIKRMQE